MNGDRGRFLIVGLGNPGKTHHRNRHNVGFMVVDRLAKDHGIGLNRLKHKAIIGDGRIADRSVILAKPQNYMNRSGGTVGPLSKYFKISIDNLMIIYDEIDLPFGTLILVLSEMIDSAVEAVTTFFTSGIEVAMTRHNGTAVTS
jgi:PTH1 family peptidyl-tRNA hydrolase